MKEKVSKSPVALENVSLQKRKFGDDMEYKMNYYSKVVAKKNLSFPWKMPACRNRCERGHGSGW